MAVPTRHPNLTAGIITTAIGVLGVVAGVAIGNTNTPSTDGSACYTVLSPYPGGFHCDAKGAMLLLVLTLFIAGSAAIITGTVLMIRTTSGKTRAAAEPSGELVQALSQVDDLWQRGVLTEDEHTSLRERTIIRFSDLGI